MEVESSSSDRTTDRQPNPLEPFILLAKGTKGEAAVKLIHQALEAPNVYVFSELLDCPNLIELKDNPKHKSHLDLLELFAYGIYSEYTQAASSLPPLTDLMLKKLRHLTLVSLATGQKSLPLPQLAEQLSITSNRELEDLVIEAIYAGIISGRLDQKNGILEIDFAIGRDIKLEQLESIENTLQAWCQTCNSMLTSVDLLITQANLAKDENLRHKNNLDQEIMNMKASLKAQAADLDEQMPCQMVTESKESEKKRSSKKGKVSSSKFLGMTLSNRPSSDDSNIWK